MKIRIIIFIVVFAFVFNCSQESSASGILQVKKGEIKINGSGDTWAGRGEILKEVGLPGDGGMGGFDIKSLQMAYDEENLYFLIHMDKGIDEYFAAKEAGGTIGSIYLDTDNDTTTGCVDKDMYGFPNLNGYDVHIWIPVGVSYSDNSSKPLVSYGVYPPREKRDEFEISKKIAEAGSLENPDIIQHKGKAIEFAIPLKALNIKTGTNVKGVISEYANSFNKGAVNNFTFSIK